MSHSKSWIGEGAPALAREFKTPLYVYSRERIEAAYRAYEEAFNGVPNRICYALKANPSLALLKVFATLGAGADIVSGGELKQALRAGFKPLDIVFSGVGKTDEELALGLDAGIGEFNVESESEIRRLSALCASRGARAHVTLRVNPNVDPKSHPYISTGLRENKFGVAHGDAERLYRRAAALPAIEVVGIGCHVGSMLIEAAPFVAAAERLVELVDRLEAGGIRLQHIDVGGGIGIRYRDEAPQPVGVFVAGVRAALGARRHQLVLDPGRSIVGNAGVLLTRVEYVKPGAAKNFLVVDAAMNDLIRAPLYGAWHEVKTVRESAPAPGVYDIVGPVCESGDFLAKDRRLGAKEGDLLAIMSAGAYGMAMSSNYNSRPRAPEVLVRGPRADLVRSRETAEQLFALEHVPG